MRILCIGDIVSRIGRSMLFKYVDDLKYKSKIDLVIANGENSNHGRGMTRACYNEMTRAGVDAFTMGNHVWVIMSGAQKRSRISWKMRTTWLVRQTSLTVYRGRGVLSLLQQTA